MFQKQERANTMKRVLLFILAGFFILSVTVDQAQSQQKQEPKPDIDFSAIAEGTLGLVAHESSAYPGYTLFAPKHNTMTYLIDNNGFLVHQWNTSTYEPGQTVYLMENGNLLRCCFTHNKGLTSGGEGGRLEMYDWDDNLVWEYTYASNDYMMHHDVAILPNGNILALAVEKKSLKEATQAGFSSRNLRDREIYPEYVIEIEPTGSKGGKIVWQWNLWDHLIQETSSKNDNYGDVSAHPELVDVNCNGKPVAAFWNHMNSIDYNAELDQILLSARGSSEIWIIDHSTTTEEATGHTAGKSGKGGDILYRWGNPTAYDQGSSRDRQLFEQHDAQWIPEGYPGAGNILIFNNGLDRGYSSVEEITPPIDSEGNYLLEEESSYGPIMPVWSYTAENKQDFYSTEISGAQRLPNGNTLICAGVLGVFFEVDPAGATVWKYANPVVRGGILAQGETPGKDDRGHYYNAVFKVHRYPLDYPGLAGRDLSPQTVVELPEELKGKTGLDQQNANTRKPVQNNENSSDRTKLLKSLGYL
jgi:hypothetical protein